MTSPGGTTAMLRGGLGLLALALGISCYRVATSLSFMIGYGERNPHFVLDWVRGGSFEVSPGVVILCLLLSVAAALLLRSAAGSGAVAFREHPRIPFQIVAWVLAGLFLIEIVLRGVLAVWAVAQWFGSSS